MFGRRGFIGMIAAFLGFEIAGKADAEHGQPEDIERLKVQLAGCGVAALGGIGPATVATPDMWGWSASYQDVLYLRRKFEAAIRLIGDRAPFGQAIMLYPCGCSAVINEGGNNALPRYCSEHGNSEHTDHCHVIRGEINHKRPTIAELEDILAQDGNGPSVSISLDGQVWVNK